MTITGEQVKAARELLGWTQEKLAGEAALSTRTVGDFEGSESRPSARTINMLQRTLETAGVEFVGRRAGVRLKKASANKGGPAISDEDALPEMPKNDDEPYDGSPV